MSAAPTGATTAGPGDGGSPAIAVDGLVKRYGPRNVVDGVSLAVDRGELVALLGPNGAGKTTTVEIVEGYRTADAGTVRVLGHDPGRGGRELRARVGLMLQAGGFDMRARPRETLHQYARFHAEPRDADALLERVGLGAAAGTPYRRLSGGERQRLGPRGGPRRPARRSSSSTSRRPAWIRRRGPTCAASSRSCGPTASRSC